MLYCVALEDGECAHFIYCFLFYSEKEKSALMNELEQSLQNDNKAFFENIKPKVVEVLVITYLNI